MSKPPGSFADQLLVGTGSCVLQHCGPVLTSHPIPFGGGIVFGSCWDGRHTVVHRRGAECPNCGSKASNQLGSLHYVALTPTSKPYALFLPDLPTRQLLSVLHEPIDQRFPALETSRPRGLGSPISLAVRWVDRSKELEPGRMEAAQSTLKEVFQRLFFGRLSASEAAHSYSLASELKQLV